MSPSDLIDPETERAARIFAARIAEQYDPAGMILFGSRARRNHRSDSDLDVAVLLHGHREHFFDTALGLADTAYDVLLETGVLIEAIPIWEDEWEHPDNYTNPALLRNIRREGIRL